MWVRLVEEHDAHISESTVRALVARLKRELRVASVDVAVVQTHLAGDEAEVIPSGSKRTYVPCGRTAGTAPETIP